MFTGSSPMARYAVFLQYTAVLLSISWFSGCDNISPKPDFVMQMNGFCPDDQTRARIQSRITDGIGKLTDPDLKLFLATAKVEDNIPFPVVSAQGKTVPALRTTMF
jgi:hypothetical protein